MFFGPVKEVGSWSETIVAFCLYGACLGLSVIRSHFCLCHLTETGV